MEDIILVGYGGHAKSVADSIEHGKKYRIAGYTDQQERAASYPYLGTDANLRQYYKNGISSVAICIGFLGTRDVRKKLYRELKDIGFHFPVIVDPSAVIAHDVVVGEGSFIGKNAVINTGAMIGEMCIINTGAIIEHNNRIGAYSHIAVGAVLCGRVQVGEHTFIGANATIIQEVQIGMNAVIGAGSTVIGNVPDGGRVVGLRGKW